MLTYKQTRTAVTAFARANIVPLVWGPPGVGKTAMAGLVAAELNLPLCFFNPSDYEPHEIAGVMAPEGEVLRRLFSPKSPLHRATQEAVLLVIDELNAQGPSKFPAIARIINERLVGDNSLHEGTRVICFSNTQSQSLEGNDLPLPLLNRVAHLNLGYTVEDFQEFLSTYGEPDSLERKFALSLSGVLDYAPDLLEVDPSKLGPKGAENRIAQLVATNQSWATPRALEKLIKLQASVNQSENSEIRELGKLQDVNVELYGAIMGVDAAAKFLAIRVKLNELPSIKSILAEPLSAPLPKNAAGGHFIRGLLPAIGRQNPEAGWFYVDRLRTLPGGDEVVRQLYKPLTRYCPLPAKASPPAKKLQLKMASEAKLAPETSTKES